MIKVLWLTEKKEVKLHLDKHIRVYINPDQWINEEEVYDLTILDRTLLDEETVLLDKRIKSYTLYVSENVEINDKLKQFFSRKMAKKIEADKICSFIEQEAKNFFPHSYGEKFSHNSIGIAQGFRGKVRWEGNYRVILDGEYGKDNNQIIFWRNNLPLEEGQALDLWLEYKKDQEVEVKLCVIGFAAGSLSDDQQYWEFNEKELEDVVTIDNQKGYTALFFSLHAKGRGRLDVIALHDRHSRRGYGAFLPGGKRWVSKDREEIFSYFEPGDLKPPLHVYFSGYKTRQGFEGYHLMKKMGSPFLLIAEGRLEGGSFYIGSEEYEQMIVKIIDKYRKILRFTNKELIFSGLSMGTYGALYYASDFAPYAVLLGKPLVNVGKIAENERLLRPGGFPTSIDVVKYVEGDLSEKEIEIMNERVWNKVKQAEWKKTKFIISYMIEDDYDDRGYETLISRLDAKQVQIYGKGIHGRHNDDTRGIVNWYCSQLETILQKDFERGAKKE